MVDEVHVLAISKTGENGFPVDQVVEVAVFRVDLSQNIMESVFDTLVKQDTSVWSEEVTTHVQETYGILPEAVESGRDEEEVASELRDIIRDKVITGFDIKGDFQGHLTNEPYDLNNVAEFCSAVWSRSSFIYRPSTSNGTEALRKSYQKILPEDPAGAIDCPGAYGDAARASALLLDLHERGLY